MRAGVVALPASEPTVEIVGEAGDGLAAVEPVERLAARGQTVPAPRVAERLVARMRRPAPVVPTTREVQVPDAVADGLSNADIGKRLVIAEATVKTHLLRVFAKSDVSDRTHGVGTASESGLLPRAKGGPGN
ncbi:response regulator transcription factor [Embleya sp. AB8]|uniref:response regulator transcription factor n=1 Tax=Embleya sp. AB8 TaxID=3156304 RepID=UPI003C74D54A